MIRLEHIEKRFPDGGVILKDVNAVINDGDVICVIGPSGTGKSTLLRCINMLSPATGGRIFLDDVEITGKDTSVTETHQKIGMVFQSFNLFEHLSVIENVMLPQVEILKKSNQEAYDTAMDLLASVGMAEKWASYPSALSGGQSQRVAIARTLAMDPEVILFDEPTSALDPAMVDEVKMVIKNVAMSGKTMMIVTHDMGFARTIANRVFFMDQGIIYDEGTPEDIFDHPHKENTRKFIRRIKVLEADINTRMYDFANLAASINAYGQRNDLPPKTVRCVQAVTEELVQKILVPDLPDMFNVHIEYEYSQEKNLLTMEVSYDGPKHDPIADLDKFADVDKGAALKFLLESDILETGLVDVDDALSLSIIDAYTEKHRYTYNPEAGLANKVKLLFKS